MNPANKTSEEQITLRPATAADDEFILACYASTRAQEMAQVPWNEEQKEAFVRMQYVAQKQHYAAEWPRASHDVSMKSPWAASTLTGARTRCTYWISRCCRSSAARELVQHCCDGFLTKLTGPGSR
jgi:hypothetical protein